MSKLSKSNMKDDLYSLAIDFRTDPSRLDDLVNNFVETWAPAKDGPNGKCGSCKYIVKDVLSDNSVKFSCDKEKCSFRGTIVNPSDGCIYWKAGIF